MITNYYTLAHIAAELEHSFANRTIDEIFTQHRSELVVSFKEILDVIIAGCEPANNYIFARKTFARAKRNSANLFTDIHGTTIERVFIHRTDRQLHIRLNDKRALIYQMFGSKANVLLVDANGIITETFLKKQDAKVTEIKSIQADSASITPGTFLSMYADQPPTTALKRILPQFGPVLVRELLARVGLNGEQTINTFLENEIARLLDSAKRMKEELLDPPSPRVYFDGTSPVRFSIIPLHHLRDFKFQDFDSVSEAIQTYRANLHHEQNILQEKEEIVRVLEREHEHVNRSLSKISEEAEKPNRAKQYRIIWETFDLAITSA